MSHQLRLGRWIPLAVFTACSVLSFAGSDSFLGYWPSPLVGLLAAILALAAAVVGIKGRTGYRFFIPAFVVLVVLAAWIRAENLKRVDYITGATGIVVDSAGQPVSGATVKITFAKNVFQAIEPVRDAGVTTDEAGSFRFSFISCGDPRMPFELSVGKSGYRSVSIRAEGFANRRIVLQRAS